MDETQGTVTAFKAIDTQTGEEKIFKIVDQSAHDKIDNLFEVVHTWE